MSRRERSDSIPAAVAAARATKDGIRWPDVVEPLSSPEQQAKALKVFAMIGESRAIQDWRVRPGDIVLAAQLAKITVMCDELTATIEREGWVVPSPKNPAQSIRNPAIDAVGQLSQRQLALNRMLANGPSDRRTVTNNARTASDARALYGDDEDALFAQPTLLAQ